MSRRRKSTNTIGQRPNLNVKISLRADGAVEIDPQFNKPAIEHLDTLYKAANREDYDIQWTDDHKIAFFLSDMIDGVLGQYDPPDLDQEVGASIPNVPHIRDIPVRDVFDLNRMDKAKMPN